MWAQDKSYERPFPQYRYSMWRVHGKTREAQAVLFDKQEDKGVEFERRSGHQALTNKKASEVTLKVKLSHLHRSLRRLQSQQKE